MLIVGFEYGLEFGKLGSVAFIHRWVYCEDRGTPKATNSDRYYAFV